MAGLPHMIGSVWSSVDETCVAAAKGFCHKLETSWRQADQHDGPSKCTVFGQYLRNRHLLIHRQSLST
jgi:hypothetical protein